MRGDRTLETAIEWLRPLVYDHGWDYVVIWRLGDDPSRFIEWGACSCSGGNRVENEKNEDKGGSVEKQCKDGNVKHTVRTQACKVLAQLPCAIPLYSGIHGDVVISKQPMWTAEGSVFTSGYEPKGTQVLVPVDSGLVELFSFKHVPKDQNTIDYISARFDMPLSRENINKNAYSNVKVRDQISYLYSGNGGANLHPLLHYPNFLPQISLPNNNSSFEGSSTCTSLSSEHQSLQISPQSHVFAYFHHTSQEKSKEEYLDSPSTSNRNSGGKRNTDLALAYGMEGPSMKKIKHRTNKGPYKSKNLMTERNRRRRIKDGIFALRALVPKITKMDRASTILDAAAYIEELQEMIAKYHSELIQIQEEDCIKSNAKTDGPKSNRESAGRKAQPKSAEKKSTELQVEVNQIGAGDFLVKLIWNQKQGGFSRLMEAMDSLGLQVIDVNVTTLNGSVLNTLRVEAERMEIEPRALKTSLLELLNK